MSGKKEKSWEMCGVMWSATDSDDVSSVQPRATSTPVTVSSHRTDGSPRGTPHGQFKRRLSVCLSHYIGNELRLITLQRLKQSCSAPGLTFSKLLRTILGRFLIFRKSLENIWQSTNLELGSNKAIIIVINTLFLHPVGCYYTTLLLNRELVSRVKLCLVSVFTDIVKDCRKIRNLPKIFLKKFRECGP